MDLPTGYFTLSVQEVAVGQPGAGGLVYARSFYKDGWRDNYIGVISSSGTTYTVSVGGGSETFVLSGGVYASDQDVGSSLTYNSGTQIYTYTSGDGTVALFDKAKAETSPLTANEGKVTSITQPSGEKLTFTYKTVTISSVTYNRLQSVTNNLGYQLKFEYSANTATVTGDLPAFRLLTKVTGLNNAVDYCDPTADSCSFSQTWPNVVYATPGDNSMARTSTDTLSQVSRLTYDSSGRITGMRRPSASSDTATITYDSSSRVTAFSNGTSSWTYSYSDSGANRTTTATDPLSHNRVLISEIATGLVSSDTDGVSRTTSYAYDGSGRRTRVTSPAGNYVDTAYDARGNVTSTTQVAVSGSGLSNIVTSASFDSTCTYPVKCNKPNTTTDATGAVTNYTYADTTHGGLLTVTQPAATSGGTRPETRITYTALYAYYKNSGGSITIAATPVYLPTATSTCTSGSSCSAASTEVKVTLTYGATSVANNLLPTSISLGAGDGSLTATTALTWDSVGNKLTVDGPLSGSDDTARYRYDAGRQLVGVVGPDPDGAGALKFRASRTTYNSDGQVTSSEVGTVTAQSDSAWSSMSVLQQGTVTYDSVGRATKRTLVSGGATQAVLQYSYDTANRLDCTAVRMNPAVFGSLPSSACTLGTTGSNGPDRITRNTYSAADQITKSTSAYGVSGQAADDATLTYNSWGLAATAADAMGGLTTYEYDGFGRPKKTRYPIAGTRTSSSTTDYEEKTYDAYGRVSQARRRDGAVFGASYDLLSRLTTLDAPSGMNDNSYTYDLLGRTLTVAYTGHTLTYVFDALGRQTSATGPLGTISYQYDLAGHRTRTTWPDSVYVTYDYDLAGEMTVVRETPVNTGMVLATYAYDDLGQRATLTRGNGVVTTYTFDSASRLTSLVNDLASTGSDQTYTFTYAANFQALTRAGSNSTYAATTPANVTRSYTSNGLNQLTASGALSLTYSGNGSLTSDGVNSYSYDAANRLTGMTGVTLSYDPLGRLYQTVGSSTTKFQYEGADLIGEYNSSNTLLRRYVHGPSADEPLVWYEGSAMTDRRWLVADQLGSVVAVTNGSGAMTATNTYDEYGTPGSSNTGRFQYTGQTWVSEVGLYNYKARFYSPTLGRFMQPDPIGYGDGMNMYAYVGNDPINTVDPKGLAGQKDKWVSRAECKDLGGQVTTMGGVTVCLFEKRSIPVAGGGEGPGDAPPTVGPGVEENGTRCSAARNAAAELSRAFDRISNTASWMAFGGGAATIVLGVLEVPTLGGDTPLTAGAAGLTGVMAGISTAASLASAAFGTFASGGDPAYIARFAIGVATDRMGAAALPGNVGKQLTMLYAKAADVAMEAKTACP